MFGRQVSIESIAREVAALAGVTHLLEFDTSKADGQFRKPASCDVLMSKLPAVRPEKSFPDLFVIFCIADARLVQGFVFTPFSEGLKESWEWLVCACFGTHVVVNFSRGLWFRVG